jgi:hypothetical protein
MSKSLIVVCERYDKIRSRFEEAGWDAWSLDILPSKNPKAKHIQDDAVHYFQTTTKKFDMMICFPPCTYVANSGNNWLLPSKNPEWAIRIIYRRAAISFARFLFTLPIKKKAMENPVGALSTKLFPGDSKRSKPTQYIQPFHYGHPVSKRTCLWLEELPELKPTKIVEPEWHYRGNGKRESVWNKKIGDMTDKSMRGELKSITFDGIADAMVDQWGYL